MPVGPGSGGDIKSIDVAAPLVGKSIHITVPGITIFKRKLRGVWEKLSRGVVKRHLPIRSELNVWSPGIAAYCDVAPSRDLGSSLVRRMIRQLRRKAYPQGGDVGAVSL